MMEQDLEIQPHNSERLARFDDAVLSVPATAATTGLPPHSSISSGDCIVPSLEQQVPKAQNPPQYPSWEALNLERGVRAGGARGRSNHSDIHLKLHRRTHNKDIEEEEEEEQREQERQRLVSDPVLPKSEKPPLQPQSQSQPRRGKVTFRKEVLPSQPERKQKTSSLLSKTLSSHSNTSSLLHHTIHNNNNNNNNPSSVSFISPLALYSAGSGGGGSSSTYLSYGYGSTTSTTATAAASAADDSVLENGRAQRGLLANESRNAANTPASTASVETKQSTASSFGSGSTLSTLGSSSPTNEVAVPYKLYPFVKRLEDFAPDLTEQDIFKVLFIIRLADAMLSVYYATFLTASFVHELKKKLGVTDLELEIEIAATRWTYQQGAIMTYHRIASDFDGAAMHQLARIGLGVLEDTIRDVTTGLSKIAKCEQCCRQSGSSSNSSIGGGRSFIKSWERWYRQFPGRMFVMPLLASTGCVVFFDGTLVDFGVCLLTGTVAGFTHYMCCTFVEQLSGVEPILVAMFSAMLSALSTKLFPGAVCFPAQVLGSLFCFLYGISFVLSLYEVTQDLILTGLSRFCLATIKSFVLAFGVVVGLWIVGYGGIDRIDEISATCTDLQYTIHPIWYNLMYPAMAIGALMHLRISSQHWPVCFMTQLLAVKSQYFLSVVWRQPIFVSNLIPALIATLAAHVCIVLMHKLNLTGLMVRPSAFHTKKLSRRKDFKEPLPETVVFTSPKSPGVLRFVDHGWADQGQTREGYRRNKIFQYQRSDLWFCLVPSLYLLVPGATIWRIAFFSIIQSSTGTFDQHRSSDDEFTFTALVSGVFVIGMGQVMGIRLALAILWASAEVWRRYSEWDRERSF